MKKQTLSAVKDAVKYWWLSLIMGILAVAVGIWCLAQPLMTFGALTVLFVAAFLVFGIFDIVFAVSNRKSLYGWGWTLAIGIIDILFAIILTALPGSAVAGIFVYFVGFWIMFRSIWAIGTAAELNQIGVKGWGWMLALSILGVIFSVVFILSPIFFGGVFIVAFVSAALIVYGIFRIYLAIPLKSLYNEIKDFQGDVNELGKRLENKIKDIID